LSLRHRRAALLLAALAALGAAAAALAWRCGWLGTIRVEPSAESVSTPSGTAGGIELLVAEPDGKACPGPAAPDPSWVAALGRRGWSVRVAPLADLLETATPRAVLVLPANRCLAAGEARRVRDHVAGGGGLLVLGAAGTVRPGRSRPDWRLLEELTGAERFETLPEGEVSPEVPREEPFVAVRPGSPLAVRLAGQRLQPGPGPRVAAVALGHYPYWSDAQLVPRDPSLPASYQVAALHHRLGDGRVVWLGFSPREARDELIDDALAWVVGRARAELAAWPEPYDSAASLAVNLAATPENASFAATALLDAGVHGTFLIPGWLIEDRVPLPPLLGRAGELAMAEPPLTATRDRPAAPPPPALLWARLRFRWALGGWPRGALAGEPVGANERAALAGAGLTHALVPGGDGSVRPELTRVTWSWGPLAETRHLVLVPRAVADDLHLSPLGLTGLRHEWIVHRVLADHELVAGLGGVQVLLVHTQGLSAPDHVEVLEQVLAGWRQRPVWVTDLAELAAWWRDRHGLSVDAAAAEPGEVEVRLVSRAARALDGVAVVVHLPAPAGASWSNGVGACRVRAVDPDGGAHLVFDTVGPGEERRCVLHSAG